MHGFTKTVARELAAKGVTANVIAPGFVTTDMTDALPDKIKDEVVKLIPLARFGQTDDIAAAVAFLGVARRRVRDGPGAVRRRRDGDVNEIATRSNDQPLAAWLRCELAPCVPTRL